MGVIEGVVNRPSQCGLWRGGAVLSHERCVKVHEVQQKEAKIAPAFSSFLQSIAEGSLAEAGTGNWNLNTILNGWG